MVAERADDEEFPEAGRSNELSATVNIMDSSAILYKDGHKILSRDSAMHGPY